RSRLLIRFVSMFLVCAFFFFSSRRRHTRSKRDWSSDVCSSDLRRGCEAGAFLAAAVGFSPAFLEELAIEAALAIPEFRLGAAEEIGRASCRERGEIAGGAVALKEKEGGRTQEDEHTRRAHRGAE